MKSPMEIDMSYVRPVLGFVAAAFLVLAGLTGCTKKSDEVVYKMGFTPAENAEVVSTNGRAIADIIERKTGIKIKTYVATDYTALIEAMRGGTVDFAWFASFGYVLAEQHAGAKVLLKAVRKGNPYFYSAIIVRSDSKYKTIQDLKGTNIAWVDPASASGYIVPKASLLNDGIDADKFFKKQIYAGGHDTVVLGVINKSVDAGATFANEADASTGGWNMLATSKPEYKDQVRAIYVSKPIPNDTFATSEKLMKDKPDVVEKVRSVVKELDKSEEGKTALKTLYRIDSMIDAQSSDYDPLRKAAAQLNMDVTKKVK
jgi:phosphonate transport system substrate-binding protein